MRGKKYQIILLIYLVLIIAGISIVIWTSGVFSLEFWVLVSVNLVILALLFIYSRYRKKNEIVKCQGCGRTMTYDVFKRVGSCPKCHTSLYTRTGVWPKG